MKATQTALANTLRCNTKIYHILSYTERTFYLYQHDNKALCFTLYIHGRWKLKILCTDKKKQSNHATSIAFIKNASKAAYLWYQESNLFLKQGGVNSAKITCCHSEVQ
jgi:hypothetical protein